MENLLMMLICKIKNKIPSLNIALDCVNFTLRFSKKIKRALKLYINKPDNLDIVTEVEIDNLRRGEAPEEYRQDYIRNGFPVHNLSIQETARFQFIRDYQNNAKLRFADTCYWKLADFSLAIHKERVGGIYLHNKREPIYSATQMCNNFIELYKKIKSKGKIDLIKVMATYDGKYVIIDGLHRAAIAHALGFKKVAVKIVSVDSRLRALMELLKDAYPAEGTNALYAPLDHAVFSKWKTSRNKTRWMLIKDEFAWKGKKILDIGSYTGYFSHKIANSGAKVTGIDIDDKRLDQAKRINILLKSNVEFIHADFFEYLKDKKVDAILFFSVLHWILKDRGMDGVRETLQLLSAQSPVMFFDMGQDNEPKMRTQEWTHGLTINKKTIPDLIISNSRYKYFRHLGTGDTGRDVFKFGREAI
ncbi:methyltransferase domain-containing protein [Candidatus Omnitrophota bacterium]